MRLFKPEGEDTRVASAVAKSGAFFRHSPLPGAKDEKNEFIWAGTRAAAASSFAKATEDGGAAFPWAII